MKPHVGEALFLDMSKCAHHPVQKRLAADQAVIWMQDRLPRQMLACPKANFKLKRAIITEQYLSRKRPIRHINLRQ